MITCTVLDTAARVAYTGAMPKGVYPRSEAQRERLRRQARPANEAAMRVLRGRPRTEEQKQAQSLAMTGREAWNKGVPMTQEHLEHSIDHGHATGGVLTPTYISWRAMKQRCNDPNKSNYKYYGGRGIRVCDRWSGFENFLADMGERPDGTELSRVDNDGHYEPGNVEWSTKSENVADRNRRARRQDGSV